MKVLDCTLRDGGYYNKWDFDPESAKKIIEKLVDSGVDIIEVGYKSLSQGQYFGLFKYCPESVLGYLKDLQDSEFSVMVDIKEFIHNDSIDEELVMSFFIEEKNSIFSIIRIASYEKYIKQSIELAKLLKIKGYKVCLNYMGTTLSEHETLDKNLDLISKEKWFAVYFSDSFGSMLPNDVVEFTRNFKSKLKCQIGFHAHDNQGLAYINALTAINEGVDFIDSTLMGIGRGAGNLKTEQLLLSLFHNNTKLKYKPNSLLDLIENEIVPLYKKYNWGWNYEYMLSGLKNIHPSYCQYIKSNHQYSSSEACEILNWIPNEFKSSFSEKILMSARKSIFEKIPQKKYRLSRSQIRNEEKELLILANAPNSRKDIMAIREFISNNNLFVIECNDTGLLEGIFRKTLFLNKQRLHEFLSKGKIEVNVEYIYSKEIVDESLPNELKYHPVKIDYKKFNIGKEITIPNYNIGSFALAYGIMHKPKTIYVAGFDGYSTSISHEQQIVQETFDIIKELYKDINIISLTETAYKNSISSVYSML